MEAENSSSPVKYEVRHTEVYSQQELAGDILKPESLLLKTVESPTPLDFGAFCYARRVLIPPHLRTNSSGTWKVDLSSLMHERSQLVRGRIDQIVASGNRETTISAVHSKMRLIIEWIDDNDHSDFLKSEENATDCYREYIDNLYYRIATDDSYSAKTANESQREFVHTIKAFFGEKQERITRSIAPISFTSKEREAPESRNVRQYFDVLKTLSFDLSKLLVNKKPFPLHLKFDSYDTYLFHGNGRNILTPYYNIPFHVYNFRDGRIATANEYNAAASTTSLSIAERAVKDAATSLKECNDDPDHETRLTTYALCLQSYACLFQLITGANPGLISDLEYQEAQEIVNTSIKKEFTTIKMRAKGKVVRLPVGGTYGRQLLKDYLLFRESVLQGQETEYLFFSLKRENGSTTRTPIKLPKAFQSRMFTRRLRGKYLPDNFENISPAFARVYKNVIIQELGVPPAVASKLLGHTTAVNARHYSGISREKQQAEFTRHWGSVRAAAEQVKIISSDSPERKSIVKIASGACDAMGEPESVSENVPIQPSCVKQYGCLFCKHYCCHADREDIHKLLSLIYVSTEVRKQAENPDHADSLLREMTVRARYIVKSISEVSNESKLLVENIECEVFDRGIITPFWENKLSRFERKGVIL